MSFKNDNAAYEAWLRSRCDVVEKDLQRKHQRMKKNAFTFLRATFFRWARRIETVCPALKKAPGVLSVGDVHLENFGTWRDAEGRLVWGINDFDDTAVIPYAYDIVRLATSARLLPRRTFGSREAAMAILAGYRYGLDRPRPTLLDDQETWMRPMVACSDDDRQHFWDRMDRHPDADPPPEVVTGLQRALPDGASMVRFASRSTGGGSLGRPRFLAIAEWRGGRVVREAKALVPSAWEWAHGDVSAESRFSELAEGASRSPDPYLRVDGGFVYRRLAADTRKVELDDMAAPVQLRLLKAMAFDVGSIHAASGAPATAIRDHVAAQPANWLHKAAKQAAVAVRLDYESWKDA